MIFTNESQSISRWKCAFSAVRHGTLGGQQKWSNGILLDPMTHQVMLLQKWLSDKWSTDEKAFRADWGHFLFLASSANITDALLVVGDLSNSCKEENPFTGQGSHQQAADRSYTNTYDSLSDVGESRVWFASKNLTQIIAKCHSFPNMYDML